ncbi:putative P-type Ca(2+) transporter [Helianthus debilis subsp. tardiflorus]
MNTAWGKMMSSIQGDNEQTTLQSRVNKLTCSIRKVGLAVAFLVLVVMLVCYFSGKTKEEDKRMYNGKRTSANKLVDPVTGVFFAAVVVAIPEGLPLTVTLTLTYSLKRMLGDKAMVRKLFSCETMCSATVICTKKPTETSRFVGVEMMMRTGDYDFTAKAIDTECGIVEPAQEEEEEEEEEVVCNFTDEERMQKVDKISVMARSSPLMVMCSKQKGHVVAVTGDMTNDAPTLEEADIGLSIEIQET